MNPLDVLLAVVIGGSLAAGFRAGLARTAIGLLAVIGGIGIAFWYYQVPAEWLQTYVENATLAKALGFAGVFFALQIAGALLAKVVGGFLRWTGLSGFDRVFGAGFGLVRGLLMATAFIAALMAFTPSPPPAWMVGSKMLPYAVEASDAMASAAPQSVKDAFRNSLAEIRKAWDEQVKRAKQYREKVGRSKLEAVEQ